MSDSIPPTQTATEAASNALAGFAVAVPQEVTTPNTTTAVAGLGAGKKKRATKASKKGARAENVVKAANTADEQKLEASESAESVALEEARLGEDEVVTGSNPDDGEPATTSSDPELPVNEPVSTPTAVVTTETKETDALDSLSNMSKSRMEGQEADETSMPASSSPKKELPPPPHDETPAITSDDRNLFGTVIPFDRNLNNNLLVSRLHHLHEEMKLKSPRDQEQISRACQALRTTFNEIKASVSMMGNNMLGYNIDWELWTRVVNNYDDIVLNEPDTLQESISEGIPTEIRGMVWQLISNSKNFQLEELYASIRDTPSEHEKAIKRDLSRTSFVTGEASAKMESLFHVIKAYSLFDPEVGYTQGMAFIAVPLLMNMNDSEAFCLLVTLMKDYNLRSLFLPEMRGLHLLLYQFDRLLEDQSPYLFNHLTKQGVRSSMYASQWFLTFFAYRFPLDIVLRIYDTVITEGMEAILKFGVSLMVKNESSLLPLTFDKLLEFLKEKLFNVYTQNDGGTKSKRFSFIAGKKGTGEAYRLSAFVKDASRIDILPFYLQKYQSEFDEFLNLELLKESEIKKIRFANGKLRSEVKLLESNYVMLDRENIAVVNQMVHAKVKKANNADEILELEMETEKLREKLGELRAKLPPVAIDALEEVPLGGAEYAQLPSNTERDIQAAMEVNLQVMDANLSLEEQLMVLEKEMAAIDAQLRVLQPQDKKTWFTPFWSA